MSTSGSSAESGNPDGPPNPFRGLDGDGSFETPVVGESYRQDVLEALCGGKTDESVELEFEADLILEDDNPHDPNAVRVEIQGRHVGYLARPDAPQFRRLLAKMSGSLDVRAARVPAMIRGGWDRGPGNQGYYGVWLDITRRHAV